MPSLVHADLNAMYQLKVGLVQSASKYTSEANLLRGAATELEGASQTNSHAAIVESAMDVVRRLEAIGASLDVIADGMTPEIERLSALTDLTRRS